MLRQETSFDWTCSFRTWAETWPDWRSSTVDCFDHPVSPAEGRLLSNKDNVRFSVFFIFRLNPKRSGKKTKY